MWDTMTLGFVQLASAKTDVFGAIVASAADMWPRRSPNASTGMLNIPATQHRSGTQ
jgi:hypothetical protein